MGKPATPAVSVVKGVTGRTTDRQHIQYTDRTLVQGAGNDSSTDNTAGPNTTEVQAETTESVKSKEVTFE
ncbi:hypothetical protein E2C01_000523 [Portunus trituberculatus]|uniref:Uncharacterized protein n=1 Tax=Portunus trituberculatus TaxID=210409 RepID=A0A5B7CGT3_PORTR|nr:hypothetical protein [Portunus trituberculatus]